MSDAVIESVALHEFPEYRDGCVEVLREEWGRSKSARLSLLEKSNAKLPYSIALLERQTSDPNRVTVIGHSRMCRVYGQSDAAFVESVVVLKKRRNQGIGRKLMEETEQHALRLGITTLYLSTHDKQDFYSHIGYDYCTPVVSSGAASAFLTEKLSLLVGCCDLPATLPNSCSGLPKLMLPEAEAGEIPSCQADDNREWDECSEGRSEAGSICQDDCEGTEFHNHSTVLTLPPPPPPPTPLASRAINSDRKEIITRISVYWMKKELVKVLV